MWAGYLKLICKQDFNSIEIKGERLSLRPVSMLDADDIFKEFTPAITRYMLPAAPDNLEQVHLFIEFCDEGMRHQEDLVLAITHNSSKEFLGVCALHGKATPETPELGIWLKQNVHRQGYGREAVRLLAHWARDNIFFDYLCYPVDRDNTASRRIAEGLGGEIIAQGHRVSMSGHLLNEITYKITGVNMPVK